MSLKVELESSSLCNVLARLLAILSSFIPYLSNEEASENERLQTYFWRSAYKMNEFIVE